MSHDIPPKTHNNPPDEIEILLQGIDTLNADLTDQIADIAAVAKRNTSLVLFDAGKNELAPHDLVSRISDEVGRISAVIEKLEQRRDDALAPLVAKERAIKNTYLNRLAPLIEFKKMFQAKTKAWQDEVDRREAERRRLEAEEARRRQEEARREREAAEKAEADRRRAAEEAERKAAKARSDAAKKAAEEKAAELRRQAEEAERVARQARQQEVSTEMVAHHTQARVERGDTSKAARVRGDRGTVTSLRKFFDFRIVNEDQLPRRFLVPDLAAIKRAINGQHRMKSIPGIEIFEDSANQTKRK